MHVITAARHLFLFLACALLSTLANASTHTLDQGSSTISMTFQQLGRELQGHFSRFNAAIRFDEHHVDKASVYIDLDVSSVDTGYPDYNAALLSPAWLNAEQFPLSTFTATAFTPKGIQADGIHVDVAGTLIIKGRDANVHFPVSVVKHNGQYIFTGTLPIKRLAYNIGEDIWHGTAMVANEVTIRFHLVTTAPESTQALAHP